MSLKSFHILFMIVTTLFLVVFGLWSVDQYLGAGRQGIHLTYALGSAAGLVAAPFYGRYFLRKLRNVGYL